MPRLGGAATFRAEMATEERFCRLEQIQGREVPCPEEKCTFWEPGGTVAEGRCVLQGVDFAHDSGLAEWLTELRESVEQDAEQ